MGPVQRLPSQLIWNCPRVFVQAFPSMGLWTWHSNGNAWFKHMLAGNKSIDVESFFGNFYLWRYVSTKLPLPIPHLERIIPHMILRWNTLKGVLML